ncbi:MAG: hypothetical protein HQL65_02225 [Magnetococcales bacterium]|nr:hypothetical protein [Magnetococcales bacterium]
MLKGAVVGAVAGAGLGALMKGDVKSALWGAAAGAAVGALGGYWASKVQQGQDQAVLDLQNDMIKDGQEIDKTQEALKKLISCRTQTANKIRADLKAKRISRPDAESQMAFVKSLAAKDAVVWDRVRTGMNKRMDEYKFAVAELEKEPVEASSTTQDDTDTPQPVTTPAKKSETQPEKSDTKAKTEKKKVTADKTPAKKKATDKVHLPTEKKQAQKILTSTQSKWAPTEKMGNDYVQNISTGFTLSSDTSFWRGFDNKSFFTWTSGSGQVCRLNNQPTVL